ncbi:MAG: DUF3179 domain-containing protein [Planctomycetes bacterium]|nr:DUF3179 domain-containing protein [Planctomycetota bacterium]
MELFGLSVTTRPAGAPVLIPYTALRARGLVGATVDGAPVVAVLDPETAAAAAFVAQVDEQTLTFEPLEGDRMRDAETGSVWVRSRGVCVEGQLQGARLEQLVATPWLIRRWQGFYPDGRVVGAPDEPRREVR